MSPMETAKGRNWTSTSRRQDLKVSGGLGAPGRAPPGAPPQPCPVSCLAALPFLLFLHGGYWQSGRWVRKLEEEGRREIPLPLAAEVPVPRAAAADGHTLGVGGGLAVRDVGSVSVPGPEIRDQGIGVVLPPKASGEDLSPPLPASGGSWSPVLVAASLQQWGLGCGCPFSGGTV